MKWLTMCILLAGCTQRPAIPKELAGFSEISRRELTIKNTAGLEVRYKRGASEAVIRTLNGAEPGAFDKAVDLREFELAQPFRAERSPYPGAVSDTVQCPEKFKPRTTKTGGDPRTWRAEIYSTARKAVACGDADFVFKSVELIYYCGSSRKLVNVTAYLAKDEKQPAWNEWFSRADCEN